jgi:hypothetical protein
MTLITNLREHLAPAELADLGWPMTDTLKLEAAMVLWEIANDIAASEQETDSGRNLCAYRESVGTVQLRHDTMALIEPLHLAWHIAYRQGEIAESFDWDFTPWFLQNCVNTDPVRGYELAQNWADKARAYGAGEG